MRQILPPINTIFILILVLIAVLFAFFHSQGYSQTLKGVKGEIINVNHELQVAFTDIGDRYLKRGDILEVETSPTSVIYVQVLETSKVISKLGLGATVEKYFNTGSSDFNKIEIGDTVRKANVDVPEEDLVESSEERLSSRRSLLDKKPGRQKSNEVINQFEDLSNKFLELSDEYESSAYEKEEMKSELEKVRRELNSSMKEVEKLKNENEKLKEENNWIVLGQQSCSSDKKACAQKVTRLKNKISILKEKFENIGEMIDRNIAAYEMRKK